MIGEWEMSTFKIEVRMVEVGAEVEVVVIREVEEEVGAAEAACVEAEALLKVHKSQNTQLAA
jgi:hypothetical protein